MGAKLIKGAYSEKNGFKRVTREIKAEDDHIKAEMNVVNIYKDLTDQTFTGFGGAITDSSCKVLDSMHEEMRRETLYSYFGETGIGYTLLRVPLDSCDFSEKQYSAVTDWRAGEENEFSFKPEHLRQIEIIKEIYDIAGKKLEVMLCPWSPPASMKDNGDRVGGKLLAGRYEDYADYICNYILHLKEEGIAVTSITIQNEQNAWQTWDSCLFSEEEEMDFINRAMIPALKKYNLYKIKILLWDHNKERVVERAVAELSEDRDSMIAGVAFHWYTGDHFDALKLVHRMYPEIILSHTEGCVELTKYGDASERDNAERYAHDILGDLQSGTNSYYDWNIILDETGGPNYVDNYCDAPVIYSLSDKKVSHHLTFHYIGMISRYIKPGAVRLETSVYDDRLSHVAFKNPDGSVVLCLLNNLDEERKICCRYDGRIYEFEIDKHSINTLLI